MKNLLDLAEVILTERTATPHDIARAVALIDLHRERRLSQRPEAKPEPKPEPKPTAKTRRAARDDDDRSYLE